MIRFAPCDRQCPPRNGTFPADRAALCWPCQDYWSIRDIEEGKAQAKHNDRVRLAPLLADLRRLVEVHPAEVMEIVTPLFDAFIEKRSRLVRAYTSEIVKEQLGELRPDLERFITDLLVAHVEEAACAG